MKTVALLGMPNTGKSTLFNRLTGAHARVGNWPGITVDLLTSKLIIGDQLAQFVDLPGIYNLSGYSEDEKVVTTFLTEQKPDLILLVMNASQLERSSKLLIDLLKRQVPLLLVLTMADEAKSLGITIDTQGLIQSLGLPICLLSAKYGQGMEQLQIAIKKALKNSATNFDHSEELIRSAFKDHVQIPLQSSHRTTEKIDRLLLHPWFGLPIFFTTMLLVFHAVFTLGAPLQDGMSWLLELIRSSWLEPLLVSLPSFIQALLLDGIYNGVATVASFVLLIILFFIFLGIIEDSGYLSRAAFLMDALMAKFGLDGRSFVMLLMGFGCNVPALMGTRVIRSKGLRLLTMLTIPFSLCSARLQIFVFFTAALFTPTQAPWVLFSLYIASLLSAMTTALIFKGQYVNNDPFVLEMPPYRFPTTRQIILRGWQEVRHFLSRASKFIILGVLLVWLLTNLPLGVQPGSLDSWAGWVSQKLSWLTSPIGIDPKLGIALIFGFVAKEIVIGSLSAIYGFEGGELMNIIGQQINWIQAYSFMLFALIYTPCLSTVATMHNESKSLKFTIFSLIWSFSLAWIVSFCFYNTALFLSR